MEIWESVFSNIWLFLTSITVPGFPFSFGVMYVSIAVIGVCFSVLGITFGIGGHSSSSFRSGGGGNVRISKNRTGDDR